MGLGLDISVVSEGFVGNEDRRWLGARMGADVCRSITLDPSTFEDGHISDKGAIPSGTLLGMITATELYGPYDEDADDGRDVCAGLLFNTTSVGQKLVGIAVDLSAAAPVGAPLFWTGIVKQSFLPEFDGTTAGEVDAGARADLPTIRWEE